jgi:HK97 family phage prohead protease
MSMELRFIRSEVRADTRGRKLKGYAVRYDARSTHYIGSGVRERIAKTAFTRSVQSGSDIRMLYEHRTENLLGRTSAGNLRLANDDSGLGFELDVPNTTLGNDVLEQIRVGNVRGMSFGFLVDPDGDSFDQEYDEDENGDPIEDRCIVRTVHRAQLFEISAVSEPCYEASSVMARNHVAANLEARAKAFREGHLTNAEIDARNRVKLCVLRTDLKLGL